jgi:hypothetical protein
MTNKKSFSNYQSSSEKINYLVRPAKQVERKLIVEALCTLSKVYNISEYKYIGMGSLFYVDFKMIHKYLGIKSMISFEKEEDKIQRFDFNRPYDFINLVPGISTDILPSLDWENNMIIWLDYDMPICSDVINDLSIVSNYIKKGSILIITLDAKAERFDSDFEHKESAKIEGRLTNLKNNLHPNYPTDISKKDVSEKSFPLLIHKIISNAISENLVNRNMNFSQIFNFIYKDSSKMYTFGCVFEDDFVKLKESGIYDLEFVSVDSDIINIEIPLLTPLEKLHLDKLIPDIKSKLKSFKMDAKKLDDYEKYYKYYPQYFESYL